MSRAVIFNEYGDPSVLRIAEIEPGRPGFGEVRVRARAAGLQPFDSMFRGGGARQFVPATFPGQRLGNELAGVIDAVGEGVTVYREGDEVLGWVALAALAEHVIVPADQLVPKPAGMAWAEAGALSASGQTAHTALRELGVSTGDTVLIHAAAGGVGSLAVQLASAWGARVLGTASPRNHGFLRSLGAIPIAYGEGLAERIKELAPAGVDAVLDAVATEESLRTSVAVVSDLSRVGAVAFNPLAAKLGVRRLTTDRSTARLAELTAMAEQGRLVVTVSKTFPLERVADAQREVETGHVRGKVVVLI